MSKLMRSQLYAKLEATLDFKEGNYGARLSATKDSPFYKWYDDEFKMLLASDEDVNNRIDTLHRQLIDLGRSK